VEENLDTISFKEFNEAVYSYFEGVKHGAEESTSFLVSRDNLYWWLRIWIKEMDDGLDA
jgi:hypothetical protein